MQQKTDSQARVETGGQKALRQAGAPLQPASLSLTSFQQYPPEARALAERHLPLLRVIPLPLLPLLLREVMAYDWRFPRERERIASQLDALEAMTPAERSRVLQPFASVWQATGHTPIDWVNDPGSFLDSLTAALWSSGQMPAFRQAVRDFAAAFPETGQTSAKPRQVFVVLDSSLTGAASFARLRPHGVALQIRDSSGMETLLRHVELRAANAGERYRHWYVDGAAVQGHASPAVTVVSYDALSDVRKRLLERARDVMSAERSGPEELRTLMNHLTPGATGLRSEDETLAHFQLSLLTEGSGTQIFATTFVQWAARECLRRAEPETLLLRFTPRQVQQEMNEMLAGAPSKGLDGHGSLVDAEQAAYYTWINLRRLSGADQATFLAWHAGSGEAVLLGPGQPHSVTSPQVFTMTEALKLLV